MIHKVPSSIGRFSRPLALAALFAAGTETATAQMTERLDPATRVAVQPVIDSAAARGLPTRPLVSKALEGAAKHANLPRIVTAVRSLAADLAVARGALGAEAGEDALVAGVAALRTGVSAAYLREIRDTRGAPAVAWPLIVLADLVSRGVPVDTAAGVVLVLARAGATDNAYSGLQEQLRREMRGDAPSSGPARPAPAPAAIPPSQPVRPGTVRRP